MESGIEETSIVERKDKWKKGKTREEKDEKKEKLQEIKGRNYIPSGKKKK